MATRASDADRPGGARGLREQQQLVLDDEQRNDARHAGDHPRHDEQQRAPAAGAGSKLSLSANPSGQLEYNTKTLSAKAGKVTIAFTNMAPLSHDVSVESSSGQTLGATPIFSGGTKSLSLELKPGTYKFFCTVPGHRQAGMEGTLTVQ